MKKFLKGVSVMKITDEMKKRMTKKQLRVQARQGRCLAYQGRNLGTLDMKSSRQYDRAAGRQQARKAMEEI